MTLAQVTEQAVALTVEDRVALIKSLADSLAFAQPPAMADDEDEEETAAERLLRLIDEADLDWENSFEAKDAKTILWEELGKPREQTQPAQVAGA